MSVTRRHNNNKAQNEKWHTRCTLPPKQDSKTSSSFFLPLQFPHLSLVADLRSGDVSSCKEREELPKTMAVLLQRRSKFPRTSFILSGNVIYVKQEDFWCPPWFPNIKRSVPVTARYRPGAEQHHAVGPAGGRSNLPPHQVVWARSLSGLVEASSSHRLLCDKALLCHTLEPRFAVRSTPELVVVRTAWTVALHLYSGAVFVSLLRDYLDTIKPIFSFSN